MLVNIHFQKYNRYNFFLKSYLYCNNEGLEPRQRTENLGLGPQLTRTITT